MNLALEIPQTAGLGEDARRVLNDRLRRIQEQFEARLTLTSDADAGGFRIMNLGNPEALNDAVNQAAARLLTGRTAAAAATSTTTERVITETRLIGGGGTALATIQSVTLTVATTAISATVPATAGALLLVFIAQDATGSRAITWSTAAGNFKSGTPVNISPVASTTSVYIFAGQADGFWWLVTNPLTEWTP